MWKLLLVIYASYLDETAMWSRSFCRTKWIIFVSVMDDVYIGDNVRRSIVAYLDVSNIKIHSLYPKWLDVFYEINYCLFATQEMLWLRPYSKIWNISYKNISYLIITASYRSSTLLAKTVESDSSTDKFLQKLYRLRSVL